MSKRRDFLKGSGSLIGGSWLGLNLPLVLAVAQTACTRREAGSAWQNLSDEQAAGFSAIADQIIPPDESPGASEIGVVYFLDEALNEFLSDKEKSLKKGLADINRRAKKRGSSSFDALPFSEQTLLLKKTDQSPWFRTMIDVCNMGLFALPEYGGNRGNQGWKLIGFEHQHVWQPPFGHYDEQDIAEGAEHQ